MNDPLVAAVLDSVESRLPAYMDAIAVALLAAAQNDRDAILNGAQNDRDTILNGAQNNHDLLMAKTSEISAGVHDTAAVPLIGRLMTSSFVVYLDFGMGNTVAISAASGEWQTILDVSGAGCLRGVALYGGAVAQTHSMSLRVTVDGVAYERTVTSDQNGKNMLISTGGIASFNANGGSAIGLIPDSVSRHRFATSLKIEAKRSLGSIAGTVGYTHSLDR